MGADAATATFESASPFRAHAVHREVGLRSEHRPQDDIAKAQDEDQHSNRLDVRARHDNLPGVFIDDERAEHDRAEHDDAVRHDSLNTGDPRRIQTVSERDGDEDEHEPTVGDRGGFRSRQRKIDENRRDGERDDDAPHPSSRVLPAGAYDAFDEIGERYVDHVGEESDQVVPRNPRLAEGCSHRRLRREQSNPIQTSRGAEREQ